MTRYVALYCRISVDRAGREEGVRKQERWGRDYAARTWPGMPVTVFSDNDVSGGRDDVVRPGYDALREAIRRGEVAHLWAVEQSRLERREIGWFQLAAELDAAGITELHTNRDGIVRVQDAVAGIKAVIAASERRTMLRRQSDTLAEIAANGEPPGSRPFGYIHATNDNGTRTYAVVPEQADAIRWAAEKVLDGWSLANVAAELRGKGLHGPHRVKVRNADGEVVKGEDGRPVTRPSTITPQSVRGILMSPTIAGQRVHRGRVVGPGNWEPILDVDTWRIVRDRLSVPRVVRKRNGGTYPIGAAHLGNPAGRRYVLTGGLAVCGVCGAPMVGSVKQLKNSARGKRPYLLCHPNRGGKGCTGIMLTETEQHVLDRLWAELDRPEFLAAVAADDYADERDRIGKALQGIERQRNDLAALWATPGELTTTEWQTARRALDGHERQLRSDLAALPPPLVNVDISTARESWDGMTLDEQREFIRLFVARVTINRAKPGTRAFDPGRVEIEWHGR